jgi:membrane-bound metal-dependent hydrolase YbcI (DUF457 family)
MQTYTHGFFGMAGGALLFPNNPIVQIAFIAGSVAPDLVMIPKFVLDKVRGRPPMEEQSDTLMLLKNVSHSIPLWLVGLVVGWLYQPSMLAMLLFACALGGLIHPLIDRPTHCDPEYRDTENTYLWPLPFDLNDIKWLSLWEYRSRHGDLWPKWQEAVVCLLLLLTWTTTVA